MNIRQCFQQRGRDGRVRASFCGVAAMGIMLAATISMPAATHAQSTTANIFGQAPAGETVIAKSSEGLQRGTTANAKGRYKFNQLPQGSYTVSLQKDGKTVDTRSDVALIVGRGAEVDFACPNDQCAASANR